MDIDVGEVYLEDMLANIMKMSILQITMEQIWKLWKPRNYYEVGKKFHFSSRSHNIMECLSTCKIMFLFTFSLKGKSREESVKIC